MPLKFSESIALRFKNTYHYENSKTLIVMDHNEDSIRLIADVIFKNTTLSQLKIGFRFSIMRFVLLIKSNTSLNSLSLKSGSN